MNKISFDSAERVAAYLAAKPLEIICAGSTVPPIKRVSAYRRQWYAENNHHHQHREILIPISGMSWYGIAGKFYACEAGRAFCIDGGVEHENLYSVKAHEAHHLWVSMLAEHATVWVYDTRREPGAAQVGRKILMRYASMGINPERLWRHPDECSREAREACLRIIAETFLLRWFDYAEDSQQRSDSVEHQQRMVDAVKVHIDKTAGYDASLDRMAELAGYSKFHFLRLFKEHADCTLQEYIDSSRKRRVAEMLAAGTAQKDIASTLGFSCAAAFSRWKRKHLG